jgi:hypothetical protein
MRWCDINACVELGWGQLGRLGEVDRLADARSHRLVEHVDIHHALHCGDVRVKVGRDAGLRPIGSRRPLG